jgi:hypothetical protein
MFRLTFLESSFPKVDRDIRAGELSPYVALVVVTLACGGVHIAKVCSFSSRGERGQPFAPKLRDVYPSPSVNIGSFEDQGQVSNPKASGRKLAV